MGKYVCSIRWERFTEIYKYVNMYTCTCVCNLYIIFANTVEVHDIAVQILKLIENLEFVKFVT